MRTLVLCIVILVQNTVNAGVPPEKWVVSGVTSGKIAIGADNALLAWERNAERPFKVILGEDLVFGKETLRSLGQYVLFTNPNNPFIPSVGAVMVGQGQGSLDVHGAIVVPGKVDGSIDLKEVIQEAGYDLFLDALSAPVILSNGDIIFSLEEFGLAKEHIIQVNSQGKVTHDFTINGHRSHFAASPVATFEDNIVHENSRVVYVLDSNLTLLWKSPVDYIKEGMGTAVGEGAYYYIGSRKINHRTRYVLVKAVPYGTVTYSIEIAPPTSNPVIDSKGNIIIVTTEGLLKFSPDLELLFQKEANFLISSPTVVEGDSLLAYSLDGLISYSSSGQVEWHAEGYSSALPFFDTTAPLVDTEGTIYTFRKASNRNTVLVALNGKRPLAKSTWPTTRGNSMRTGRALHKQGVSSDAYPDLTITHISTDAESILSGDTIQVQLFVKNTGTAPAGETITRIRLSTDTTLTKHDLLPENADLITPALGAGESVELTQEIMVSDTTPSGMYYVGAFADAHSSIGQANESNDGTVSKTRFAVNKPGGAAVIETGRKPEVEVNDNGTLKSFSYPFFGEDGFIHRILSKVGLRGSGEKVEDVVGKGEKHTPTFTIRKDVESEFFIVEKEQLLHFPLEGKYSESRITSHFGDWWLDKFCLSPGHENHKLLHVGADFRASSGDEVYAVADGIVRYAKADSTWGGYVAIEHSGRYTTTSTHITPEPELETAFLQGDIKNVKRGDKIGVIAPGNGYPPHLHFQFRSGAYGGHKIGLVGRLPDGVDCITVLPDRTDPAFPEKFVDPETLNWE